MQGLIGITCAYSQQENRYWLRDAYVKAVERTGAVPLILPYLNSIRTINEIVRVCDGFVLSGGGDLDPAYWGEEPRPGLGEIDPQRDRFETALVKEIIARDKPGLFICRGIQVLNVVLGGDLIQDLTGPLLHQQPAPRYHPTHDVFIEPDTILFELCGTRIYRVNSMHHQGINRLGQGLKVAARASDGLIEAVEYPACKFILGVQWHPEALEDEVSIKIFRALTEAACGL